jgi:hypothetical protein
MILLTRIQHYAELFIYGILASMVLSPENSALLAQVSADSSFYPLEVRNLWQVRFRGATWLDTMRVDGDTVMPNGKRYSKVQRSFKFLPFPYHSQQFERVDSAGSTWLYDDQNLDGNASASELLMERFSSQLNAPWPSYRRSIVGDSARIISRGKILTSLAADSILAVVVEYPFRYGETTRIKFGLGVGILMETFELLVQDTLVGARVGARSYGTLTGVRGDRGNASPNDFDLSQNYPNPFNPSTTITYDLPARSHVRLRIFNVLGQEVATLVDGNVEAGGHQVQWNAGRLASGVYLYQLKTGGHVETKKMVVLR